MRILIDDNQIQYVTLSRNSIIELLNLWVNLTHKLKFLITKSRAVDNPKKLETLGKWLENKKLTINNQEGKNKEIIVICLRIINTIRLGYGMINYKVVEKWY